MLAKQPQDPMGAKDVDAASRNSSSVSEALNAGHALHNMSNVGLPSKAVAEQNTGNPCWPAAAC